MLNAHEEAHKAYGWLRVSDVRVVESGDAHEVYLRQVISSI